MRASFFVPDPARVDLQVEEQMAFVQKVIESLRTIRSEMDIPPGREIGVAMKLTGEHSPEAVRRYAGYLQRLAKVTSLSFLEGATRPRHAASAIVEGEEIYVPLEGLIDLEVERGRIRKEIDRVARMMEGVRAKLENQNFVARAPEEVVRKEREKLEHFGETLEKLTKNLHALD